MSLPLEIIVTANTSGVTPGLTTVTNELGKVAVAAQKSDSSLQTFGNALSSFSTKGQQSVFNLTEKLRELQSAVFTEKDTAKIAAFNSQIQTTQSEITRLSNVGKTGFDNLGNAITKSTGNPLNQAYSNLRKLAYIIPGIGLAGIFNLAFEGISAFVSKISDTNTALSATAKAQQALNVAIAESKGSVAGEVVELQSLVSIAKDTSLSYLARTQAIQLLNKEYPALHGNLSLENIGTQAVTDTINREIEAIKRRSQAKALEKLIDEESVKLEKAKAEGSPGQLNGFQKFLASAANTLGAPGAFHVEEDAANDFLQAISDGTAKIDAYTKKLQELNKESAKAGDLIVTPLKVPTLNQEFEKQLQALQKYYESVQEARVKDYHANLSDSTKNGIVINQYLLADEIDFLTKKQAILNKFNKSDLENFKELEKAKQKLLNDNLAFTASQRIPDIEPGKQTDFNKLGIDKIDPKVYLAFSDAVLKAMIALDKLDAKQLEAAKIATSILDPAFDSLFTSILEGSGNAFQAFGQALNQAVKQIAVTLLKAIALGAILAAITGKPFNIGTIISNSIKGFAGGVKNFEGGVALVGEQGPELVTLPQGSNVIPNSQISGYGGGTQVFIPQVEIKGANLLIVFNRAQAQASRNG